MAVGAGSTISRVLIEGCDVIGVKLQAYGANLVNVLDSYEGDLKKPTPTAETSSPYRVSAEPQPWCIIVLTLGNDRQQTRANAVR